MDPTQIAIITMLSTISLGVLGKVLHMLRTNVKSCCGIIFRSIDGSTPRNPSPPNSSSVKQIKNRPPQLNLHRDEDIEIPRVIEIPTNRVITPEQLMECWKKDPNLTII